MSLELVKSKIASCGEAVVIWVCRNQSTRRMEVWLPEKRSEHPVVTEVTGTHVIGYWRPEFNSLDEALALSQPGDIEWAKMYYPLNPQALQPKPFRVKHDGTKFAFGGGSSATRNYFFENVQ